MLVGSFGAQSAKRLVNKPLSRYGAQRLAVLTAAAERDKAFDAAELVTDLRCVCVTPHVAQKSILSAIDGRATRHIVEMEAGTFAVDVIPAGHGSTPARQTKSCKSRQHQTGPHAAGGDPLSDCLRIQGWAILRKSRAPMATWIMASETSRRCS